MRAQSNPLTTLGLLILVIVGLFTGGFFLPGLVMYPLMTWLLGLRPNDPASLFRDVALGLVVLVLASLLIEHTVRRMRAHGERN